MKHIVLKCTALALAAAFATSTVSAQNTPAGQARSVKENVKQDFRVVKDNVKQDWRDLTHGRLGAAHARHKRVISGAHQRHRTAVRQSHARRVAAAKCLTRYGKFNCQQRGYHYSRS